VGTSSEAADLLLDYMQDEVGLDALQGFTPAQMDRALDKVGHGLLSGCCWFSFQRRIVLTPEKTVSKEHSLNEMLSKKLVNAAL
jgi:hypothetical protein